MKVTLWHSLFPPLQKRTMSGQDGKVRYYRLQTEGKTNVHFQGKDVYCGNLKTAFNSVCSWPVCAALLLLLWMTWFLVWLSSNALLVSEIGKNLTVVRIPKSTADKTAAFCLDGSSPAYYFRRGRHYTYKMGVLRYISVSYILQSG